MTTMTEEATVTFTPGQRVRVASGPGVHLTCGQNGYASQAWQGREVVVRSNTDMGVLVHTTDGSDSHYLHPRFLTPIVEEAPRQPGEIREGDRVRSRTYGFHGGGLGTVVVMPLTSVGGGPTSQTYLQDPDSFAVKLDAEDSGGYFGGGVYVLPRGDLTLVEEGTPETASQPAEPEPEIVNPIPVGTRVIYDGSKGVVIDKHDPRLARHFTPAMGARATYRGDQWVGIEYEGTAGLALGTNLVVVPDTSDLTPEQQIARLQRLIHRVASYEAVRRDWCSEVDSALAPLDLPEPYSRVNRELGRRLRDNPSLLLVDDEAPVDTGDEDDDEDDEEAERDFEVVVTVDVSETLTVRIPVTSCHDECAGELVDESMVDEAIQEEYGSDSWQYAWARRATHGFDIDEIREG